MEETKPGAVMSEDGQYRYHLSRHWGAGDQVTFVLLNPSMADASGDSLVAGWGANAQPQRVDEVLRIPGFERIHYLRLTKSGQPSHPLYLSGELTPTRWHR